MSSCDDLPDVSNHVSNSNGDQPIKRKKSREDNSEGDSPLVRGKKARNSHDLRQMVVSSSSPSSAEYRKDREEWSDSAINSLLDSYTEKFEQLNRGNLRGRDWEDVATIVSEHCEKNKPGKTVEQCKNKIDNLKKRYKLELQRVSGGQVVASHWPWFKKMEVIVLASKTGTDDDKDKDTPPNVVRNNRRYQIGGSGSNSMASFRAGPTRSNLKWKRVLLKVSGAALASATENIDPKAFMMIAREIEVATRQGVQVAVIVGGKNIFNGDNWISATGADRAATFQICMMASMMNAMILQASLEKIGVETRVQTAITMEEVAEPYIMRKAVSHLVKGRVVVFGGVTALASPLITTDAAAALRASEIHADVILKGITGEMPSNVGFEHLSYREFISRPYTAMDTTAVAFCEENNLPVVMFKLLEPGNISKAIFGEQVGTLVDETGLIC